MVHRRRCAQANLVTALLLALGWTVSQLDGTSRTYANVPLLTVVKTANLPQVFPGDNLVYTFQYANIGSSVNNVVVTENIPPCATYVSSTNPTTGGTTSYSAGVVTASLGTLSPGATGTFTVTVNCGGKSCPSIVNDDYSIVGDGAQSFNGPTVSTPLIDPCGGTTDTLMINSGWDQYGGAAITTGDVDNEWICVYDPVTGVNTQKRPAYVITPHPAWLPAQTNSKWVSSYPTAVHDTNGHYKFEYRFCLLSNTNAFLNVSVRADDQATVYLNGYNLGFTGANSFINPPLVIATTSTDFGKFKAGQNVLTVDNENTVNIAMGFNLVGTITGQVPQYHYCCTDSACGILGTVWDDNNNPNQHQDLGELGIAGWTVLLYQGTTVAASTHTDTIGNYYFMDLPPGTYKVLALGKFFKSFSTPSNYTVTLHLGDIVPDKNFGVVAFKLSRKDKVRFYEEPFVPFVQPNPFNPEATISITLPGAMHVSMKIYNVEGQLVKTLVNEELSAGDHKWTWDGRNELGQTTASGIYFLRTVTPQSASTQKLMMLK